MVVKIKSDGVRLGLPLVGRYFSLEEIEGVRLTEDSRVLLDVTVGDPVEVSPFFKSNRRACYERILESVYPSLARPERTLAREELGQTLSAICNLDHVKPSVVLAFLLDQAIRLRATDVHFDQKDGGFAVKFRVDGILREMGRVPPHMRTRLVGHVKNAAGMASYRHDVPQEGRLSTNHGGPSIPVRASVAPAHGGETVVLRLFDALNGGLDLEALGFTDTVLRDLVSLLKRSSGMILFTGPSSSGKTTTIYSSLRHLMQGPRQGSRAVTLEDPIEFPLECASQMEVSPQRGLNFEDLLANVLRQDAEVIMVGEIRDVETATIAIRAGLTGHLILTTLHCGRASQAPRRLTDLGLPAADVAEAVSGVLSQRLVRRLCAKCKAPDSLAQERKELAGAAAYRAVGCESCLGSGYQGRTAVAELMTVDNTIMEMMRSGASAGEIEQAAVAAGMVELERDGWSKVIAGTTSVEEVLRICRK